MTEYKLVNLAIEILKLERKKHRLELPRQIEERELTRPEMEEVEDLEDDIYRFGVELAQAVYARFTQVHMMLEECDLKLLAIDSERDPE
ncbi:hypothetical protein [Pseudodesulfovibrio pelocollis]|uniref:hypothetical protein n=1 Tax=Pseudodesulfovibrio pelocollis TaxID=3051432 RepID=UPI00255A773C|nr:hypothetical protein [Pseudodesulfovibrio sp. SB368]